MVPTESAPQELSNEWHVNRFDNDTIRKCWYRDKKWPKHSNYAIHWEVLDQHFLCCAFSQRPL
jgi:hypothetical protein